MRTIHVNMPEEGVLQVRWAGSLTWVEVRGTYDQSPNDPFQKVVDGMPGYHASVLWTDSMLTVLPVHPDYQMFVGLLSE